MKSLSKNQKTVLTLAIFGLIIAVGFILRYVAANNLPMSNDEGSYLYDAYLLGNGHLPFLTSFSRAPAFMALLSVWLKIFGASVLSGRMFTTVISLGSGVLLYFIGKELKGRALGFLAFILFEIASPVAIHSSYLLTQNLEIIFGLLGSLLLLYSYKPKHNWLTVAAGLFFGLAMATRETAAVYPLFLGLALLAWRFGKQTLIKLTVCAVVTVGIWGMFWGGIATQVGLTHTIKNFEAILKMHSTGEKLSFGFIAREKLHEVLYLKIDYLIFYLLTILFGILAIVKKWYRQSNFWFLVAIAIGPILFYGVYYQRIQPEYFGSFMPGFALMSAFALIAVYEHLQRRLSISTLRTVVIIFTLGLLVANYFTFKYQLENNRGGTFYLGPLQNVVAWFKTNTKPTDEIFTAAVGIPLFSGRPLALDISRPVIFGYPHIKPDIKYAIFPTPQAIMDYLTVNQTKYYILEKSTRDSFYTGHPELQQFLESNFVYLKTFRNPTNPIEVWIRKGASV